MPSQLGREDFYVPSITRKRRKVDQYFIQVLLIMFIFAIIILADAGSLRVFIIKFKHTTIAIAHTIFTLAVTICKYLWLFLEEILDFLM